MEDKINALAKFLEIDPEDISSPYGDNFETPEGDYMVLTDAEADQAWEEDINNYIDECILPELPEAYRSYFDDKAFMRDAKMDGRGHSLSGYDGAENEQDDYYIYRTN